MILKLAGLLVFLFWRQFCRLVVLICKFWVCKFYLQVVEFGGSFTSGVLCSFKQASVGGFFMQACVIC